jgi:hypothetical protein
MSISLLQVLVLIFQYGHVILQDEGVHEYPKVEHTPYALNPECCDAEVMHCVVYECQHCERGYITNGEPDEFHGLQA